ncbi:MAG: DUF1657 domain-containing protein [Bacillota bacterium]
MTVTNEIERAIAMAEAAKGNYLLFATDSEDQKATQVFKQMADDMERHVTILESRLDYLNRNNPLNKQQQGQQQQQQQQQQQGQQGQQQAQGANGGGGGGGQQKQAGGQGGGQ